MLFFLSNINPLNNLYLRLIFLPLSLPLLGFLYKNYRNDHTLKPHSYMGHSPENWTKEGAAFRMK